MSLAKSLHPYEIIVLKLLEKTKRLEELTGELDETQALRALQWLQNKDLATYSTTEKELLFLGKNGERYAQEGLPETKLLAVLTENFQPIEELEKKAGLHSAERNVTIGSLKRLGAVVIGEAMALKKGDKSKEATKLFTTHEALLKKNYPLAISDLSTQEQESYEALKRGKDYFVTKTQKDTTAKITKKGEEIKKELDTLPPLSERLTADMIKEKNWGEFRHYDVSAAVPKTYGGRKHPLQAVIDLVREVFIEMGFTEMQGPLIETSFWCLDSMWIPQDHPARDEQDTFYLPYKGTIPEELQEKVKEAHENGLDTGSKGYQYVWDPELAKQLLLRTHTTATTFRTLNKLGGEENAKYFAIGRVFRNEAIDATHLPEFHQVEGFIMEEGLTIRHLMGFIKTFYQKMGYDDIKFKMTYNPYTEPSLEALYYDEKRGKWLELINSGIFRPESLAPYGIDKPVIAWGLGLERLAMMMYGVDNLKELLGPHCDVNWLRNYKQPKW